MTTRILITGDRHWHCHALASSVVARLATRYGAGLLVVHGAAPGVDSAFATACTSHGVTHEPHPADWEGKGKGAGPIRNAEMVAGGAVFALAVHRDLRGSKGTRDCVRRCLAAGIPVWLIDGEGAEARRITEV